MQCMTSQPVALEPRRLDAAAASALRPFANAAEVVAETLRRAIYEGKMGPGERLREAELAAEIGVSRTPIREALLILQTEGLVESVPNRGSVVRSYTLEELLDFMEIRGMLQVYAVARAVSRITEEQIAELRACCDRLEGLIESTEVRPVVETTMRYHDIVVEAAGSRMLADIIQASSGMPLIYRVYTWDTPETRRNTLGHLRRITAALARHDAVQAENVSRVLNFDVRDVVMAQNDVSDGPG
jgi:DNA-binding GntR family transcriptional regulator